MDRFVRFATILFLVVSCLFAVSCNTVVKTDVTDETEGPSTPDISDSGTEEAPRTLTYREEDSYTIVESTGYIPFVYIPASNGSRTSDAENDMDTLANDLATYGEDNKILAASNAGIFYNWSEQKGSGYEYCFAQWEPDGVVIANGVIVKSTESIDHTECEPMIITASGAVGWADYWVDADALVSGKAYYYDIHGNKVVQSESDPDTYVVSAVTGFVPILVDGEVLYESEDTDLTDDKVNGLDNYVGHYSQSAARTVFAASDDGYAIICANGTMTSVAELAKELGYVFAYNMDGGRSVALYIGQDTDEDGVVDPDKDTYSAEYTALKSSSRKDPTYIVFTADNTAPVSATPKALSATYDGDIDTAGTELDVYDFADGLTVVETLSNAAGNEDQRTVYSIAALDSAEEIGHSVDKFTSSGGGKPGSSSTVTNNGSVKTSSSPAGTLYYTKSDTADYDDDGTADATEITTSGKNNGNSRTDSKYYDYSTGYVLSSADDLSTAGEKTITVSYAGLSTTFTVTLK